MREKLAKVYVFGGKVTNFINKGPNVYYIQEPNGLKTGKKSNSLSNLLSNSRGDRNVVYAK